MQSSSVMGICVIDKHLRRLSKEDWNPHVTRVLASLSKDEVTSYALQLDEDNGCMCVIVSNSA